MPSLTDKRIGLDFQSAGLVELNKQFVIHFNTYPDTAIQFDLADIYSTTSLLAQINNDSNGLIIPGVPDDLTGRGLPIDLVAVFPCGDVIFKARMYF